MRVLTRRRLFVVAVALQVSVPAVALAMEAPTRFGFQMYSGTGGPIIVRATDTAGQAQRIDLDGVASLGRPEIDWTRRLPEHLCGTGDYVSVTVRQSGQRRELAC